MRTTVTLDRDVEQMLKEAMHRSQKSFKRALNDAIRAGLGRKGAGKKRFVVQAKALRLRPGLEPAGFNKLVDVLEVEGFLASSQNRRAE